MSAFDRLTESQRDALRLLLFAGAFVLLGAAGYHWGAPAWRNWRSDRAIEEARGFARDGDVDDLLLALRRAIELTPYRRATWEEAARDLHAVRSPQELVAREALTRLAPRDAALRLELARQALRYGRRDVARAALSGIDETQRRGADYLRVAVAVALADRRRSEMEASLRRLIAVSPGDRDARFTYAALRLWDPDAGGRAEARAELERLESDPAYRVRAAIELLAAAARSREPARIQAELARALARFAPGSARILARSDKDAWEALLGGIRRTAAANPADAAVVANWLDGLGRRADALAWLQSLPPAVGSAPAVAEIAARLAAEAGDDAVLEARLEAGAWGAWPEAAWQHAIAARDRERTLGAGEGAAEWQLAFAACGGSAGALRNLARLAAIWGEPAVAEAAWRAILDSDPGVDVAFDALAASYAAHDEEDKLLELYADRARRLPGDAEASARWVTLACLLGRATPDVLDEAAALQAGTPGTRIAKVAALWREGRGEAAERVLDALPADERGDASAQFWRAVVESELGHVQRARAALAAAWPAVRDPPERALLRRAAAEVHYEVSTSTPGP